MTTLKSFLLVHHIQCAAIVFKSAPCILVWNWSAVKLSICCWQSSGQGYVCLSFMVSWYLNNKHKFNFIQLFIVLKLMYMVKICHIWRYYVWTQSLVHLSKIILWTSAQLGMSCSWSFPECYLQVLFMPYSQFLDASFILKIMPITILNHSCRAASSTDLISHIQISACPGQNFHRIGMASLSCPHYSSPPSLYSDKVSLEESKWQ